MVGDNAVKSTLKLPKWLFTTPGQNDGRKNGGKYLFRDTVFENNFLEVNLIYYSKVPI